MLASRTETGVGQLAGFAVKSKQLAAALCTCHLPVLYATC